MSRSNPFPGMNPYMERTWADVHLALIGYIRDALGAELPEDLTAKAEQQVGVLAPDEEELLTQPDDTITEDVEDWRRGLPPVWTGGREGGTVTVAEPEFLVVEDPSRRWVEVRADDGELITVIEVLSPANKVTDREAYQRKRRGFVAAAVNVVEIDLLRRGGHTVDVEKPVYRQHYAQLGEHSVVCVSRGMVPGRRELYPCPLRQPLPAFRIPLRPGDRDAVLDLQTMINRCYELGRYWKQDYTLPLVPALGPEDKAWVAERLKAAGLIA